MKTYIYLTLAICLNLALVSTISSCGGVPESAPPVETHDVRINPVYE